MSALNFQLIAELIERGESAALCTIVKAEGSTPRHVGSKMLVNQNGGVLGTVGGGELEHRVIEQAALAIADGQPRLLTYAMSDPSRGDPGVCGGQVEVFVEPILPPAKIVVIGAGHVGQALAHLAKWLGFRVAVSDDRAEFCNPQTVPDGDEFYPMSLSDLPASLTINSQTYLVLTTRGSPVDVAGLPGLLETRAAYIGVIGSRRRWATTLKALKAQGIDKHKLARVHAPVGLELNAETPQEIAVSIMAEIIMLRHAGTGKPMKITEADLAAIQKGR